MNTPEMISVVVPSYNHAKYIGACLDSLYFQDYPNLEIIIVDDNSEDDSVAVIEKWIAGLATEQVSFASYYEAASDEILRTEHKRYNRPGRRIIFEKSSSNQGSTSNYNRGFRLARGEYCSFVASDDIAHPQLFSSLARPLAAGEADFVYADMFIIDDQQRILREFCLPDYSFRACFADWYLCGVATLYRRSLHLEHGYYDESSLADDHECYLRFALAGARFKHIARTLYSVRSHKHRQTGLHSRARYGALLKESGRLALQARTFWECRQKIIADMNS